MPDLHLRLLGAAQLHTEDGSLVPLGSRRRTLALLAMAAVGGQFGIPREKAMALLWPEETEDRARNSLRQRLFLARRAIDQKPLLRQDPDVVQIASENVAVDLWAFETAAASGRYRDAAALYIGPFLDGFAISGLSEFDRWVESHRARLHLMAQHAMEQAARASAVSGDAVGAVTWWRHLAILDPLSSRVALELVNALVAAGDLPAALNHARSHEAAVWRELDVPPDPTFTRQVHQLAGRARNSGPQSSVA